MTRRMQSRLDLRLGLVLAAGLALPGCRDFVDYNSGRIDFEPERPELEENPEVEPYSGEDAIVLTAQERFPTGLDVHKKVIWRTCTPNGGVCHNRKEYPDLRTPASFASAFSAPCNVQPGEAASVFDGCERPGDRLRFGNDGEEIEIGWVEYVGGDWTGLQGNQMAEPDTPGLHIHLARALPGDNNGFFGNANFVRSFVDDQGEVQESTCERFATNWWRVGDSTHLVGRVPDYQIQEVQNLLEVGIVMGDANRNGVYGAQQGPPVSMLEPGDPVGSYLIGRLRGELHGESVPGSRMPLANAPLSIDEMLALFCLVEGFPEGGDDSTLTGPIDYNACSFAENPEDLNLLGDGVTWERRIKLILEFNCGGCHNETSPQGGLTLLGDGVYERLLGPSMQVPEIPFITPGEPENSYLYLKLIGDDRAVGLQMPYNPLTGEGSLGTAELADIETWIVNGAIEDE